LLSVWQQEYDAARYQDPHECLDESAAAAGKKSYAPLFEERLEIAQVVTDRLRQG
jgi:hypothetical protein